MSEERGPDEKFLLEPITRAPVLRRLARGPAPRGDLEDELGIPKATMHRIVSYLTEAGLVEERDGSLALTRSGRVVADAVAGYVERLRAVHRLEPLLNSIDEGADIELDVTLFADATVTRRKPGQPQLPVQRVVDFVERADAVRALAPVLLPIYVEVFHRRVLDGMAAELVLDGAVVDGLRTEYPDQLAEVVATGRVSIYEHDGLPLGLVLADGHVLLTGMARIAVETDATAAVTWAEEVYTTYRSRAEPVDLDAP